MQDIKKLETGFTSKAQAQKLGYIAAVIERICDGRMLFLNSDLVTYSFGTEFVKETINHTYTYERLMDDPRAKGQFSVISWVKNSNSTLLFGKN